MKGQLIEPVEIHRVVCIVMRRSVPINFYLKFVFFKDLIRFSDVRLLTSYMHTPFICFPIHYPHSIFQ